MKYKEITWWPGAYHVFNGDDRLGIVNERQIRANGRKRSVWQAHNKHFFSLAGEFPTRAAAAKAIPVGKIHHDSNALSGSR